MPSKIIKTFVITFELGYNVIENKCVTENDYHSKRSVWEK
jgi:hypothetical protein